ncbi:hypothetical protein WJX73_003818 [Symbiochloris irregularis]|uniref:protein-serine/threonine phosphatase n=1 Tax=Symbiochloris irregularis TaxID=706552 RepID=A0AAW1NNB7_9CHLO
MSVGAPSSSEAERLFLADLNSLRAAASLAVAECATPLRMSNSFLARDIPGDSDRGLSNSSQPDGPGGRGPSTSSYSSTGITDRISGDLLGPDPAKASFGAGSKGGKSGHRLSKSEGATDKLIAQADVSNSGGGSTQPGCPPHGVKAVCGRRPRMEDAYTAYPFLVEVPLLSEDVLTDLIPTRIAGQVRSAGNTPPSSDAGGSDCEVDNNRAAAAANSGTPKVRSHVTKESLHFFGVFDGHGALVGSRQLYVANCGDSRAVLCRGDFAIPLTDDHKAAREDETARVEALGGQILFWNGVRVMGVLAVSRAIGDHCLRPFVIAKPEVTILARKPEDELLLLASDGLWDVLSNQEACTLAKRCLRRARQRGASRQSAARIAATVLTRAAIDRGSRDNVTVLVVDLCSGDDQPAPAAEADRRQSTEADASAAELA